jgi:hypothetical protein
MSEETYRELLIGCGRDHKKRYQAAPHHPRTWRGKVVTLDVDSRVKPDLWCDLNAQPPWHACAMEPGQTYELLPDYWDEIHAYQVLEHLGQQGDAVSFFGHFQELWRLLKPDGYLVVAVPSRFSGWLWGDPSHRRAIVEEQLPFLDQAEYIRQCDGPNPTSMSDFRNIYRGDFRCLDQANNREDFVFVLQAVKPSRWVEPR